MASALLWPYSAEELFLIERLSRPAGRDKRIFMGGDSIRFTVPCYGWRIPFRPPTTRAARAFERNHPNLLCRIREYLEKFDGAERTKEHIIHFDRKMSRYHDYQREILGNTDFTLFVETVTLEQIGRAHV